MTVKRLRSRATERADAAWERLGGDDETPSQAYVRLRMPMIEAERREVLRLRGEGHVPYEVLRDVFTAIDLEESILYLSGRLEDEPLDRALPIVAPTSACKHLADEGADPEPQTPEGCFECLRDGTEWVHLRLCLNCGHVGCCDSSDHKHATRHFHETDHPVIRSFEEGEYWRWCFVDEISG
jgi:CPA1 family monovalent cation:H+ antiporter